MPKKRSKGPKKEDPSLSQLKQTLCQSFPNLCAEGGQELIEQVDRIWQKIACVNCSMHNLLDTCKEKIKKVDTHKTEGYKRNLEENASSLYTITLCSIISILLLENAYPYSDQMLEMVKDMVHEELDGEGK